MPSPDHVNDTFFSIAGIAIAAPIDTPHNKYKAVSPTLHSGEVLRYKKAYIARLSVMDEIART